MKKIIFLFLLFIFTPIFADPDEFEKLLKQCFARTTNDGIVFSADLSIKKKSKKSYIIDGQDCSLFIKMPFKIPDNVILILQNFKSLNGNNVTIIISEKAYLKTECDFLKGEGVSIEIFGIKKEGLFGETFLCLNNLDMEKCSCGTITYDKEFNTIKLKLCGQYPPYEIQRNNFDLLCESNLYGICEKNYR